MPETSPNRQGWLIKPPPPMVASSSTKHSFFPSQSHIPPKIKPEKASTSLLPDSLQTLTLTFSDLGLKSIKFSLKHPILSKPQPLLSLWSGSKKGARVWGSRSLVPFFLCFFLWVWVGYTGSDDDGVEGEAESVDVETVERWECERESRLKWERRKEFWSSKWENWNENNRAHGERREKSFEV